MERIGIIDLGSNSVRLVIVDVDQNNAHHQIENLKETVRLIAFTDSEGNILRESVEYAVNTIKLLVKFCEARKADKIIGVATAAVRLAANRAQIVDLLEKETKVRFRVLSGEEEAYLGYLGLVNTMPQTSGLMADLGGGSLKLVSFEDRINQNVASLDFGAVSLTKQYGLDDRPDPSTLQELETFLENSFKQLPWMSSYSPVIGLGGSFRLIARIFRKHKHYVPDITDALELTIDDVKELYGDVCRLTLDQRMQVPGMESARADLSLAALATVYHLLRAGDTKRLVVSTSSIRDGLLYEHLNRFTGDPIVLSVLTHHIDNLIHYFRLDENHLRRVSNLAVTLFDQFQTIHGLGSFERRLLLVASLLHEIGVVISVEGKDKHTLYMLLNTPLHGLTHRERLIAAYVAASHDDLYLNNLHEYISNGPLLMEDERLISTLAALLQVTHSLDRCHTGVVTQVRSQITDKQCEVSVVAKSGAQLEINDARRKSSLFEKLFGYPIVIKSS